MIYIIGFLKRKVINYLIVRTKSLLNNCRVGLFTKFHTYNLQFPNHTHHN